MIWPIVLLSLWAVLGTFLVVSPRGESEHEQCLKNIGKLEMELFPDLPKELRWAKWPGKTGWGEPGQIIAINPGEKVKWLAPPSHIYTQIFPQYSLASSGRSSTRLIAPELDENESLVFSHTMEALTHSQDQWHPVGELH